MQVRRLNAITRQLQACPNKIVYRPMTPAGEVDLHSDSGYRRFSGDVEGEVKGYGIRGADLLRRGNTPVDKLVAHLIDAHCKSHRLLVRSSYPAKALAAAHNLEGCYPTIVALHEFHARPLTPAQLKDKLEM
eukprot:7796081-Pyramimonas_sp.AAC.1